MDSLGRRVFDKLIRVIAILVILQLFNIPGVKGQETQAQQSDQWTGSTEQKLWGLMTIWAETKYAFPHFDQRPDLDWDAAVRQFIPRVLATGDMDSYYQVLQELVALLEDSHTSIVPPWGYFKPGHDLPPFEVGVIDGRFIITRTGDSDEVDTQRLYPGLEILEVGGGVPVRTHFEQTVLKYHSQGSKQGNEAILPIYLFYGPAGGKVDLKVRDMDGGVRNVTVTRNSAGRDGAPFMFEFVQKMFTPTIETRTLEGGIIHVSIPNFENDPVRTDFVKLVDSLEEAEVAGMIIDLRSNLGGSSAVGNPMVGCLIDEPVSSPLMRYQSYSAAERAWGREPEWSTAKSEIEPRAGNHFTGTLVLLTNGATNSSAEDFVIELQQTGRALVVGGQTCGGAGNTLTIALPGGGVLKVSTFSAAFPDGREFAGIGIQPDVEVHPTREDIYEGTDIVLERGVEVLLKNKR